MLLHLPATSVHQHYLQHLHRQPATHLCSSHHALPSTCNASPHCYKSVYPHDDVIQLDTRSASGLLCLSIPHVPNLHMSICWQQSSASEHVGGRMIALGILQAPLMPCVWSTSASNAIQFLPMQCNSNANDCSVRSRPSAMPKACRLQPATCAVGKPAIYNHSHVPAGTSR